MSINNPNRVAYELEDNKFTNINNLRYLFQV